MKWLLLITIAAFATGLLISFIWKPLPYEEQLIQIQIEQVLPEHAADLRGDPIELRAQLVEYAGDPLLFAKARVALFRYPAMAKPILNAYGTEPKFQKVLREYGEHAIPPIHHFRTHDVLTVTLMEKAATTAQTIYGKARGLWTGESTQEVEAESNKPAELNADERGLYAVQFIHDEGHNFLGQFVVATDGEVGWIQTERFLQGTTTLFFGGIRSLETKYRQKESIELKDVGWATVDLAAGAGVLKILKMGRAATVTGRSMSFSQRSLALSPALMRGGTVAAKLARYGAPVALAYVAIRHPSVLNSMFGLLAKALGLPVFLVQALGWGLVLAPVLYVARLLLRPLAFILVGFGSALRWLERSMRSKSTTVAASG
jgi:hypothetical protein